MLVDLAMQRAIKKNPITSGGKSFILAIPQLKVNLDDVYWKFRYASIAAVL